ncbi:hypothetical protein ACQP3L_38775, partial [Escherichia coli]
DLIKTQAAGYTIKGFFLIGSFEVGRTMPSGGTLYDMEERSIGFLPACRCSHCQGHSFTCIRLYYFFLHILKTS